MRGASGTATAMQAGRPHHNKDTGKDIPGADRSRFMRAGGNRNGRGMFAALLLGLLLPPAARAGDVDFNRDVLPILSTNCFPCHGPDADRRKADLRLDVRDGAVAGKVILPGKPANSELVARLVADDVEGRM